MKSTGIVRKVDELGRIVIPIELRRVLGVAEGDAMEVFMDGKQIVLAKYMPNVEKLAVIEGLEQLSDLSESEQREIINRALNIIKSN